MNHVEALEYMRKGGKVIPDRSKRVVSTDSPLRYYRLMQHDLIFPMFPVTSCTALPGRPFSLEQWDYFGKYDEWLAYE